MEMMNEPSYFKRRLDNRNLSGSSHNLQWVWELQNAIEVPEGVILKDTPKPQRATGTARGSDPEFGLDNRDYRLKRFCVSNVM